MGKFGIKYVYELINLMGTIEYVGESKNPHSRIKNHLNKGGKFYKRQDIILNVVAKFNNKKDAFDFQCELQTEYDFESDLEKYNKSAIFGSLGGRPKKTH